MTSWIYANGTLVREWIIALNRAVLYLSTSLPGLEPTGVTLMPLGVTMVGVTTLMPDTGVVVVLPVRATCVPPGEVVVIFCVAAAAAARAAMPLI